MPKLELTFMWRQAWPSLSPFSLTLSLPPRSLPSPSLSPFSLVLSLLPRSLPSPSFSPFSLVHSLLPSSLPSPSQSASLFPVSLSSRVLLKITPKASCPSPKANRRPDRNVTSLLSYLYLYTTVTAIILSGSVVACDVSDRLLPPPVYF